MITIAASPAGIPEVAAGSQAVQAPAWKPRAPRLALVPQLRERVQDRTAAWLAAVGVRRIALYGMGRHTRAVIRQPWLFHGIEVVAVLDDQPRAPRLAGVPVLQPAAALTSGIAFDAVVVSTTQYEDQIAGRAEDVFAGSGIRVVRLYTPDDTLWEPTTTIERIVSRGIDPQDAEWLVRNRGERHDAMLPIIPPARTELHARRYELAAAILLESGGHDAADVASGTGYGTEMLCTIGGAGLVRGVDLDPEAVAYAGKYHHADHRAEFCCADAVRTGLDSASFDLVASFETIEHVEDAAGLLTELHRIMRSGATLVISTPNRLGPTPFHVHDFGFSDFSALLRARFEVTSWIGQLPSDEVYSEDLPPGMWRLSPRHAERDEWQGGGGRPDFLIAVCRKQADEAGEPGVTPLETPLGAISVYTEPGSSRTALPASHLLWRWLANIGPDQNLWDASGADPAPALACAARGIRTLLLNSDPRRHWIACESARRNPRIKSVQALGLSIRGTDEAAPSASIQTIRDITGHPVPTHLRLGGWTPGVIELLGATTSIVSVYVDRSCDPQGPTAEALVRAGFIANPSMRGGSTAGSAYFRGR